MSLISRQHQPLLFASLVVCALSPGMVFAQTAIGSGSTTIRTSTANAGAPGDVSINEDATRTATQDPALIIDSANTATNLGTLNREANSEGALVIVTSGANRSFRSTGIINMTDDYTREDSDDDGDLDGVFSTASNRVGVLIGESGTTTSGTINLESGTIYVEGNQSRGVHLQGPFQGSFRVGETIGSEMSINVVGNGSIGIDLDGPIIGTLDIRNTINAQGVNAHALRVDGAVTGELAITGTLTSYAYSFLDRGEEERRDDLDADDFGLAGSSVVIARSVSEGVIFSGVGTEDDPDDDGDGVLDDAETDEDEDDNRSSSIITYGSAAAVLITGDTQTTRLGVDRRFGYGLVSRGSIFGTGVYDNVSATGLSIQGNVQIERGILNQGSIAAVGYSAAVTGVDIAGAQVGAFINTGTVSASLYEGDNDQATAMLFRGSTNVTSITNSGSIIASLVGGNGAAVAIEDQSGQLTQVTNSGLISGGIFESEEDADDVSGNAIAVDVSRSQRDFTYRQTSRVTNTEDDLENDVSDVEVNTSGMVIMGAGNDRYIIEAGTADGDIVFGRGQDQFIMTGGTYSGILIDADETLNVQLRGGRLRSRAQSPQKIGSLTMTSGSRWDLDVDLQTGRAGSLVVSGVARIEEGARISPILSGSRQDSVTVNLITADRIEWVGSGASVGVESLPFLYRSSISRTNNSLDLTIATRTVEDLGLSTAEGSALSAVLALSNESPDVSQAINSQLDGTAWRDAYRRLLPDYTDGKISTALAAARSAANALRDLDIEEREEKRIVWAQQFLFGEQTDPDTDQIREGNGFGLTTGLGGQWGAFDLLGLTASFTTGRYDRGASDSEDAEVFALSSLSLGGVGVVRSGSFRADVHASVGYDWSRSTRRVAIKGLENTFESGIDETADGKSTGWRVNAATELAYVFNEAGAFNLTPFARVDAVRLTEDGYTETGAPGLNLEMASYNATRVLARAGLDLSYRLGPAEDGWRFALSGGGLSTLVDERDTRRARFVAAGDWFDLEPFESTDDGQFGSLKVSYVGRSGSGSLMLDTEQQGDRTTATLSLSLRLVY